MSRDYEYFWDSFMGIESEEEAVRTTQRHDGIKMDGHNKASKVSDMHRLYEVLKKILAHTGVASGSQWKVNVRAGISAAISGDRNAVSKLITELESIGDYDSRLFSIDLREAMSVVAPLTKTLQPTKSAERKPAQRKREQAVTCGRVSKYQRDDKTGASKKIYPMPDDVLAVLTRRFPREYMCELLEPLIDCGKETRAAILTRFERRKKAMFQKEGS